MLTWRMAAIGLAALGIAGFGSAFVVGTSITRPATASVGPPPAELELTPIAFDSLSGSRIAGWLHRGKPGRGAVILQHGIRANRLAMLGRARWLVAQDYSVLLFDFQAHGESAGRHISFGFLEARDSRAAVEALRRQVPNERVALIGTSLGAAAAILADPPLPVDAMVLEEVFASFDEALSNRLRLYAGPFAALLSPLLKAQVRPRLGFDPDTLRPEQSIQRVRVPVLLIAGEQDRHATLAEMRRLFAAANGPKELWIVPGAAHVDLHRFAKEAYERRLSTFLEQYVRAPR